MSGLKDKHFVWKVKSLILDYLEERGASFLENKYIIPMLKDIEDVMCEEPDKDLEDAVYDVVDYYLDELFKEPEMMAGDQTQQLRVTELDGKIKQPYDVTKKEDGEKVQCQICGKEFKVLYPHLLAKHNIAPEIYRRRYPDSPLRAGVPEIGKKKGKKKSQLEQSQPIMASNFKTRLVSLASNLKSYECERITS